MNRRKLIKQAIVVLNLPKVIDKLIIRAKVIASALQNNSAFAALSTRVEQLIAHVAELQTIIAALHAKNPEATIKMRKIIYEVVRTDLLMLRMEVQKMANQNIATAAVLIRSAGMQMKSLATRGAQQNTVSDGDVEGCVNLTALGRGLHEWRISTNGEDFDYLSSSTTSRISVINLTPGAIYYFQNRQMLHHHKKGSWSQVIKLRVP
jgi:hypothetical protein